MIEPDWPPRDDGHAGQHDPSQREPARDERPPGDALIVTLALAADDQARLDRLRTAHFPPARNVLAAHVTMFHRLPGSDQAAIAAQLAQAAAIAPFPVRVARLQSLGRGVALTLESDTLIRLRAGLARIWSEVLTAQDRQGYRPHVTIQNKVDPAVAKRLFTDLSTDFAPWTVEATGLALWCYRGGPWESLARFDFAAPAPSPAVSKR